MPRHLAKEKAGNATHIHLDKNELQKLEFLSGFYNVTEFTAAHNQLLRMYNIAPMRHLVKIDLSYNKIICIEGLKDLVHLTFLNLAHNKIKEIDHLYNNMALEYLDLSENLINNISNLSQLSRLKKLFLHKNQICHLKHAEVYLPKSIESLTLAGNKISDLNEISRLVGLINLKEISIKANPCIDMTGQSFGFDYRPFLVNWCLELKVIDGFAVDELESLRGEWLYSQGKGRQFRPGEHKQLVHYLAENLPFNNEPLQSEQERKLRLILSKAHQHQSQLMSESLSSGKNSSSHLMSRSLDPSLLQGYKDKSSPPTHILSRSLHCQSMTSEKEKEMKIEEIPAPLPAASKLVPVPESLISPMVANVPDISVNNSKQNSAVTNSSYYIEEISTCKLQTIKTKADEIRNKRINSDKDLAAICIQKNWRGYLSRNSTPAVQAVFQHVQMRRINQHILRLSDDIKSLKMALENEHKLHVLQMQAINALWRKMSNWQTARQESDPPEVRELSATCVHLNSQVQQLQLCMQEVLKNVGNCSNGVGNAVATQTDIVAVHTPDDSSFLYNRPSSLPLSTHQVTQYAENLVGDMFKDTMEEHNYETEQ